MIGVNHDRPAWHAYVRDRQQRRQDHVAALAREAGEQAPNAVERVKASDQARVAGQQAFDAAEPELAYDRWKGAA